MEKIDYEKQLEKYKLEKIELEKKLKDLTENLIPNAEKELKNFFIEDWKTWMKKQIEKKVKNKEAINFFQTFKEETGISIEIMVSKEDEAITTNSFIADLKSQGILMIGFPPPSISFKCIE